MSTDRAKAIEADGVIAAYSGCITFAPQNAATRNSLGVAVTLRPPPAKGIEQFSARGELGLEEKGRQVVLRKARGCAVRVSIRSAKIAT
jgi:hypothetical protein